MEHLNSSFLAAMGHKSNKSSNRSMMFFYLTITPEQIWDF